MVGGMDMEQGGVTKEQGEKAQGSYSIIQIVLGAIMLWQGNKNRSVSILKDILTGLLTKHKGTRGRCKQCGM